MSVQFFTRVLEIELMLAKQPLYDGVFSSGHGCFVSNHGTTLMSSDL